MTMLSADDVQGRHSFAPAWNDRACDAPSSRWAIRRIGIESEKRARNVRIASSVRTHGVSLCTIAMSNGCASLAASRSGTNSKRTGRYSAFRSKSSMRSRSYPYPLRLKRSSNARRPGWSIVRMAMRTDETLAVVSICDPCMVRDKPIAAEPTRDAARRRRTQALPIVSSRGVVLAAAVRKRSRLKGGMNNDYLTQDARHGRMRGNAYRRTDCDLDGALRESVQSENRRENARRSASCTVVGRA
ncbi:hypothetical protein [Burkholderia multivorans]|uniref:hypothetical protein n=1 Tax=Burkholderia multivorans TaxID=87883 RepID=UPI0020B1D778|nr:hypothetical protein [Burkholderia multivorans]